MSNEVKLTAEELAANAMLNDAIIYAVQKHRDGLRKGTKTPYIVHPLEVMLILQQMGADLHLLAAGLLHDTVEDTDATLEDISERFGQDVADLVASHTEDDKSHYTKEQEIASWRARKEKALTHLTTAGKREKMLVLADKLSNMRAIARDYAKLGDDLWQRFNKGREDQSWYYYAGARALRTLAGAEGTGAAYKEFCTLIDQVFGLQDR